VDWYKFTDVPPVSTASIIRAMSVFNHTPLKLWYTYASLHGATTQKTAIFVKRKGLGFCFNNSVTDNQLNSG
jgi:hypothetical protein